MQDPISFLSGAIKFVRDGVVATLENISAGINPLSAVNLTQLNTIFAKAALVGITRVVITNATTKKIIGDLKIATGTAEFVPGGTTAFIQLPSVGAVAGPDQVTVGWSLLVINSSPSRVQPIKDSTGADTTYSIPAMSAALIIASTNNIYLVSYVDGSVVAIV